MRGTACFALRQPRVAFLVACFLGDATLPALTACRIVTKSKLDGECLKAALDGWEKGEDPGEERSRIGVRAAAARGGSAAAMCDRRRCVDALKRMECGSGTTVLGLRAAGLAAEAGDVELLLECVRRRRHPRDDSWARMEEAAVKGKVEFSYPLAREESAAAVKHACGLAAFLGHAPLLLHLRGVSQRVDDEDGDEHLSMRRIALPHAVAAGRQELAEMLLGGRLGDRVFWGAAAVAAAAVCRRLRLLELAAETASAESVVRCAEFAEACALMVAEEDYEVLELLRRIHGRAPLHDPAFRVVSMCRQACKDGNVEMLQWLRADDELRAADWDAECVEVAAANGHGEVVEFILSGGGGGVHTPLWADKALASARSNGHADVVELVQELQELHA